jgi:hypothetical protein
MQAKIQASFGVMTTVSVMVFGFPRRPMDYLAMDSSRLDMDSSQFGFMRPADPVFEISKGRPHGVKNMFRSCHGKNLVVEQEENKAVEFPGVVMKSCIQWTRKPAGVGGGRANALAVPPRAPAGSRWIERDPDAALTPFKEPADRKPFSSSALPTFCWNSKLHHH